MIQKLSPRLQTCADLVSQCGTACDVGTDHAYLAVWLIQNGRCSHVTASDIGEGPLRSAAQTVAQAGLSDQITLKLTDGLNGLAPSDFSDIVIAGMGGETIAVILGAADFSQRDTRLILQPMTRGTYLRCWLAEHGFALLEEIAVQEGDRIYTVMLAQFTGASYHRTPYQAEIGALKQSDETARRYIAKQAARIRRKANGAQSAGADKAEEFSLADALEAWANGGTV